MTHKTTTTFSRLIIVHIIHTKLFVAIILSFLQVTKPSTKVFHFCLNSLGLQVIEVTHTQSISHQSFAFIHMKFGYWKMGSNKNSSLMTRIN
jgi:hypothetical protein